MPGIRWLILVMILAAIWLAAAPAHAGYEFPICTAPGSQESPAISGNIVVWTDWRNDPHGKSTGEWDDNSDIYGRDLSTGREFPICTAPGSQDCPAISANIVVWTDFRNGDYNPDIYGEDLSTGHEFAICTAPGWCACPAVSGNTVAWEDYRNSSVDSDLYGYDLTSRREFAICTAPGDQSDAAICGNVVVWSDARAGSEPYLDIYGKDLSTGREFPICTAPGSQQAPAISGNTVVWEDSRNGIYNDIFGYNVSTGEEFCIAAGAYPKVRPAVSGKIVLWQEGYTPGEGIYGRNLETGEYLLVCGSPAGEPAVSGGTVVWRDRRNDPDPGGNYYSTYDDILGCRLDGVSGPPHTEPSQPWASIWPATGPVFHAPVQTHAHYRADNNPITHEEMRWLDLSPNGLADMYRIAGYRFVAATEHYPEYAEGDFSEAQFWDDTDAAAHGRICDSFEDTASTHILGIGFDQTKMDLPGCHNGTGGNEYQRVRDIVNAGGIAIAAHPNDPRYFWDGNAMVNGGCAGLTGIEIFNAGIAVANLSPTYTTNPLALDRWDDWLRTGRAIWGFAGDDYTPPQLTQFNKACNVAVTYYELQTNEQDILTAMRAMKAGAFYACLGGTGAPVIQRWWADSDTETVSVDTDGPYRVWFVTKRGDKGSPVTAQEVASGIYRASCQYDDDDLYIRAQVENTSWPPKISWTQPIFLDRVGEQAFALPTPSPAPSGRAAAPQVIEFDGCRLELSQPQSQLTSVTLDLVATPERPAVSPPMGYVGPCLKASPDVPLDGTNLLTFPYKDEDVQVFPESTLAIYRYDEGTQAWQAVPSTVDAVANQVTAQITRLGTYALSAPVPQEANSPVVSIASPSAGAVLSGSTGITATAWDDSGVASVTFYLDDISLGSDHFAADGWAYTIDASRYPPGLHQIRAVGLDACGNAGTDTVSVTLIGGAAAPWIAVDAPTAGTQVSGRLEASGRWWDDEGAVVAAAFIGDTPIADVSFNQDGTWTCAADLPPLTGPQTITFGGSDAAGNRVSASVEVEVVPVASLSSSSVTPASGTSATVFTYRVLYTNTGDIAPSSVQVAIWSSATKTTSWRQMQALDPADTTYVDGKWYTYSCSLQAGNCSYRLAAQVNGQWVYWPEPAGTYQSGPTVTPANPVVLSSAYVTPASGTSSTTFTWRLKYWNSNNAMADEVWVAIWFRTLKRSYWYSMWAFDPADTNCKDGKWYTFSRKWLPVGSYAYRFAARVGSSWTYWPSPSGTYQRGPLVTQQGFTGVAVTLQGPPAGKMACTLALKLFAAGSTTNPLATLSVALDGSGFGATQLTLPAGTYDVWAKEPTRLARRINGWPYDPAKPTLLDFSTLLAGDLTNDNVVDAADYDYWTDLLIANDPLGDLDRNGEVNGFDYAILVSNMGKTGDPG